MLVAGFSGRTDLSKAAETSNEVRRIIKDLKECQTQALLYNQRERLFGMPVTQARTTLMYCDYTGIEYYSNGLYAPMPMSSSSQVVKVFD